MGPAPSAPVIAAGKTTGEDTSSLRRFPTHIPRWRLGLGSFHPPVVPTGRGDGLTTKFRRFEVSTF